MKYKTLISTIELSHRLGRQEWAVVDCRFSLANPTLGRQEYLAAHIPGAVYAHLEDDLSGTIVPGQTGRHPLPDPVAAAETFGQWGIDQTVQVVAYDSAGGAFAARLWWMLRWLGHESVAVLDGGWTKWLREGLPTQVGWEERTSRTFEAHLQGQTMVTTAQVEEMLDRADAKLFDARAVDRYRGENETIDPVAGHIPGAISAPYVENLDPDGTFKPAAQLASHYRRLLGDSLAEKAVFYCGSGVTAAHNMLAMAHVGLDGSRLYPGSWSEWITDPRRPVGRGASQENHGRE